MKSKSKTNTSKQIATISTYEWTHAHKLLCMLKRIKHLKDIKSTAKRCNYLISIEVSPGWQTGEFAVYPGLNGCKSSKFFSEKL